ncbi:trypsin-like serine protease [Lentzea nigeriaca]|uniref:trypsin-like serine protease n=1 Tax=Lentzea nigeriaca TaxID=1128665 RepID=UPI001958DC91
MGRGLRAQGQAGRLRPDLPIREGSSPGRGCSAAWSCRAVGLQFCGGALVGPGLVATAAHCVYGRSPSLITVEPGVHTRVRTCLS